MSPDVLITLDGPLWPFPDQLSIFWPFYPQQTLGPRTFHRTSRTYGTGTACEAVQSDVNHAIKLYNKCLVVNRDDILSVQHLLTFLVPMQSWSTVWVMIIYNCSPYLLESSGGRNYRDLTVATHHYCKQTAVCMFRFDGLWRFQLTCLMWA